MNIIQKKIYGLDFLKFVAAVLITNSHFIPVYKDVNVGLATFGCMAMLCFSLWLAF